jgi:16S rRNA processing protein RimM
VVIRISDPMAYNNDILLGRITKVSGYEGAVAVRLEKIFTENIPHMESVFLEIEGRPVPFFIHDLEYSGADILKLQFEDYTTDDKVSEFIGCRVFLTSEPKTVKNREKLSFIGFSVYIDNDVLLGEISELIPINDQWLISVSSAANKEILIPFHEDFIVKIDKRKKKIVMDLPEGLTEIN